MDSTLHHGPTNMSPRTTEEHFWRGTASTSTCLELSPGHSKTQVAEGGCDTERPLTASLIQVGIRLTGPFPSSFRKSVLFPSEASSPWERQQWRMSRGKMPFQCSVCRGFLLRVLWGLQTSAEDWSCTAEHAETWSFHRGFIGQAVSKMPQGRLSSAFQKGHFL